MYKGGPHLVCGDVDISPYHRLSGELDARGSVRVRVGGYDVHRRPDVLLVAWRVVSCRVVSCRVVGGICTGSVTVETVVLLVFITSVTEAEGVALFVLLPVCCTQRRNRSSASLFTRAVGVTLIMK